MAVERVRFVRDLASPYPLPEVASLGEGGRLGWYIYVGSGE